MTEYDKLTASGHYDTLQKVEAAAEVSIAALASASNQDNFHHYIDLVGSTGEEKVGVGSPQENLHCAPKREAPATAPPAGGRVPRTTLPPCVL